MARTLLLVGAALLAFASSQAGAAEDERINPVGVRKTVYGQTFTDTRGMTLYARTAGDACTASCLVDWRPFGAARLAKPVGAWTIVSRSDDGTRQWAYQGQPLYTSNQDSAPGDMKGDGVPGWTAAMAKRNWTPPEVAVGFTDFGPTLTSRDGKTLYLKLFYLNDNGADVSSRRRGTVARVQDCVDECLKEWEPLLAPADAKDQDQWTVVARPDGTRQWVWQGFPLYTNTADQKAGDIRGEGHWTFEEKLKVGFWEVANLTPY
jgi:predicted lipoprotein with Yx(FWY)xxD motif